MTAAHSAAGGSLDLAITRIDHWFSQNFDRVHTPIAPGALEDYLEAGGERCRGCGGFCTAGDYGEPGTMGGLRRELDGIRRALAGVSSLDTGLRRYAGLDGYQAELDAIRAGLNAVTSAAVRLTTQA